MIGSLTLPAIAFLAAISGLPGLKGLPAPASKELARARAEAAAGDTLPLPWRPASRLALENQFVQAGLPAIVRPFGPIRLISDPRRPRVTVDPDSGVYRSVVEVGDVTVGTAFRRSLEPFTLESSQRLLRERWLERNRTKVNDLGSATPVARQGISLPIPVRLPSRVQSLLGPGGPALNVRGSESIRLSGTSNWTNQELGGIVGQKKSLFPSLDMQQDLDIQLEGQLSDRIKVNLLQNSANQVPLANRIAINYRGDEDDFVQALDLGNTSLSLPGTQYVSYSGKNEGLFGVKLASRIGALDFTALASKQEGRSERAVYTGGSARSKFTFTDLDWVKGQYFLLYDPNLGTAYDVDEKTIRLYLDDGIASNDLGKVIPGKAYVDPTHTSGLPPVSDTAYVRGSFDILNPGPDQGYEVLNNIYAFHDTLYKVIRLKQPIQFQTNQTLAVTYVARPIIGSNHQLGAAVSVGGDTLFTPGADSGRLVMKLLRVPRNLQKPNADGVRYDSTAAFAPVRELEVKSFYNLGGFGIDAKSFRLALASGQEEPPVTALNGTPFIEMVGLDSWDEQSNQPRRAHDGEVDGFGFNSQTRGWVNYEAGTLFLPDPRPFAPRLNGPDARPFDQFLDQQLNRSRRLDGATGEANEPNPDAYELYNPRTQDARWYFTAEFAAARTGGSDITLGRGNILEGSEGVIVNGERWVRDRDYTVDYDLGRISLRRQLGPTDQMSVEYSYAPLFAQASKTLVGSAFRFEGRDRSLGGAFLYESKGAQDLRPRLGEEPSRTLITDLNTEWRFKPSFITRLADALPGVRTTTPSEFNIQAEAGMSFPNPNTRNEVYVDDMEGVRDAVSLSMAAQNWRWTSVPSRATSVVLGNAVGAQSLRSIATEKNAEVHWYNPVNTTGTRDDNDLVREKDLRPRLDTGQGADNVRTALAMSVPREPNGYQPVTDQMWAGLLYPLDPVGLDLSRSQFIEVWVNDFRDHHDPAVRSARLRGDPANNIPSVKLHLDIGRVSEDQMRAPNRLPNGKIDTEDQPPRDNQLTVTGQASEDTGLDGVEDGNESGSSENVLGLPDLSTVTATDPNGDNWAKPVDGFDSSLDPRRYLFMNGTQDNNVVNPIPDTEDLNLNEQADTTEAYFEYTIDLGAQDSPYLLTDVARDFPSEPEADSTRNGWRRYRIPLNDSLRVRFGFPDLTIAQHVRVWVEGLRRSEATTALHQRPLIMLGGLDIVGSRWQASDLTPRQRDTLRTTLTLNSVNTVDNAEIYTAPFDPGDTRTGSDAFKRREQSLSLEFTDLHPADTLEAFKTFSLPENYSRYGVLRWFASSFQVQRLDRDGTPLGGYDADNDSLSYFVRFASDDKGISYYELKRRMPASSAPLSIRWEEVLAKLAAMSQAKLLPDFPTRDPILYRTTLENGDQLTIKGRPSFTRLLRISFGILNEDTTRGYRYSGQFWFDELRATDVAKDVGLANRLLVNGRVANLMDYNVSWNSRDADFLSVGETRGSGSRNSQMSVSTRFEPHRFFEGTGIQLPVSYSQNTSLTRPRFTAGDDIVRSGVFEKLSETRNESRSVSVSYSRVWSERSNPLLRHTIGGITANMSRSETESNSPTAVNSSTTTNGQVNYQVAARNWLPVPLPFTKTRLYPLPERAYWNYLVTATRSEAFTRQFGSDSLLPSSSQNGRAASFDFGMDTRPFDLLSHHVEGRRNLALEGVPMEHVGGINVGRLTSWRQSFSSHLAFTQSTWIRPTFNWSSNYSQVNDVQSPNLTSRGITNGQDLNITWDLPFDRLSAVGMSSAPRAPAKPDSAGGHTKPRSARPLLPWRQLLSRLGNLSTDARIGRNTNYSRLTGTASPLYLVGLAENPGFETGRVSVQPGNTSSSGLDWRMNARTTVPLAFGTSLSTRGSMGDRTNNNNGVKSRSRDWRFPDVEVQYGRLANLIGITRVLDGAQLRTAYSRNTSWDYQNSRKDRSGTSRSDDFRPLLSLSGRLKNGTDAKLSYEKRSSTREAFQLGNSRQTDNTTDINFSLNRSYSQGQKVNVLGKTTTVKTSVNLALTTTYSRQTGGVKIQGEEKLANPIDRTRLSVNGTGSYGFSTNVTGDLALGFSHFRETNGIIRRSIRVELRGQFRF